MAQHDYVIANQSGANFRADLNNALAAIVSQNSGATAPSPTYAYQLWADTTTGLLKIRNSANNAWVTLRELDGTLALADQGDIKFYDADSSNYLAVRAPTTVSANVTWDLPAADGASREAIITNGSGALSFGGTTCRAWVRFSGGTTNIVGSYNVSSITDLGTGQYQVNIDNDFSSTDYAVASSASGTTFIATLNLAVGSFEINTYTAGSNFVDRAIVMGAAFI